MAVTQKYPVLRWLAPVVAVAAIVAGATIPFAGADATLPPKTPEELLIAVQDADVEDFSGTVESSVDLGLPALPMGDSDFTALLSGTHTVRVWQSGDDKTRVALIGNGAETTVVRNGDELWQWSSSTNTAKHMVLPEHEGTEHDRPDPGPRTRSTPQEAAEQILAAIEPSTDLSVTGTEKVAGRAAYVLVLDPKSDDTLVEKVAIAIDGETSAPLRVQVWSAGAADPAVSIGFTDVNFDTPDDSLFDFTPPAGATIEEVTPVEHGEHEAAEPKRSAEPLVVGEGWDQVIVAAVPPKPAEESGDKTDGPEMAEWEQLLEQLPTVQGDGWEGKALTSSLVTVVLTDDGRVAIGMVPTDRVVAAIP